MLADGFQLHAWHPVWRVQWYLQLAHDVMLVMPVGSDPFASARRTFFSRYASPAKSSSTRSHGLVTMRRSLRLGSVPSMLARKAIVRRYLGDREERWNRW